MKQPVKDFLFRTIGKNNKIIKESTFVGIVWFLISYCNVSHEINCICCNGRLKGLFLVSVESRAED